MSELAEESLSWAGVGAAEECIRAHFVLLVDVEMDPGGPLWRGRPARSTVEGLAGREEEAAGAERVIEALRSWIEPGWRAGGVGRDAGAVLRAA
ncbi:hypothetical protein [Kitasatospora purpeofusca]|uniref:hypothetical protein n=1 Tax=Kitasatospora purpeofusca TaxID=67352 RepID=UPI003823634A